MKRSFLAIIALAALTTAFAQAQRWEYSALWLVGGGRPMYSAPGVFLSPDQLLDEFANRLIGLYGRPSGLDGTHFPETTLMSILGMGGWELVSTVTNEDGDRIHFFKRPLP